MKTKKSVPVGPGTLISFISLKESEENQAAGQEQE
jgi:hypothetical protein